VFPFVAPPLTPLTPVSQPVLALQPNLFGIAVTSNEAGLVLQPNSTGLLVSSEAGLALQSNDGILLLDGGEVTE
jgi:hypothetical protein